MVLKYKLSNGETTTSKHLKWLLLNWCGTSGNNSYDSQRRHTLLLLLLRMGIAGTIHLFRRVGHSLPAIHIGTQPLPVYQSPFCDMCSRRRIIPGDGPLPCKTLFIGEGPGWEENKWLRPFCGKSGRELDGQYLLMAGISRTEVRVENALQCHVEDPDQDLVDCCAQKFLPGIIARAKPEVIVTLGAMALAQFGDYSLELEHGFPIHNVTYPLKWGETWTGTIFPCYHPAAGLHQSRFMTDIQEDFRNLWAFRHGKLQRPVDQFPNPDYRLLRTRDDFTRVIAEAQDRLGNGPQVWKCGIDTEYVKNKIFCWTFSLWPGSGYMVLADNHDLIRAWLNWLTYGAGPGLKRDLLFIFHNWLADAPKLAQIGMTDYKWKDTMVSSYHLGSTPQGLKVLCYRLLGMVMQDFDDLVYPFARADMEKWLVEVASNPIQEYIESLPWKQVTRSCSGGGEEDPNYPAINPVVKTLKKKQTLTRSYPKHTSCPAYFESPDVTPCIICGKPKESGVMDRDKGGRTYLWDVASRIYADMTGLNPKVTPAKVNPFKRWDAWQMREPEMAELITAAFGPVPRPTIDLAFQRDQEATIRYAARDADGTLRSEQVLRRLGKKVEKEIRKGEVYAA